MDPIAAEMSSGEGYLTFILSLDTCNDLEKGRFPAAGGPEDGGEASSWDSQLDTAQGPNRMVPSSVAFVSPANGKPAVCLSRDECFS